MQELKVQIKAFEGLLESNTYLVYSNTGSAMIIDAGADTDEIKGFVMANGLDVKHIVLTHGHFDHADFIDDYMLMFPKARVYCHEKELVVMKSSEANVSQLTGRPRVYDYSFVLLKDNDTISLDDFKFKVLNYPGHTPGSICLLCENEKIMFTGDVLFASSYGRTDFLYGSSRDMMDSLRSISKLDKEITIYPGHYNSTKLKNIFRY